MGPVAATSEGDKDNDVGGEDEGCNINPSAMHVVQSESKVFTSDPGNLKGRSFAAVQREYRPGDRLVDQFPWCGAESPLLLSLFS